MAIIKQGILGGFSGKIAGVVGSSWKGKAVMKSKPLSVANPQTAGQVAQRSKFSYCTKFGSAILTEIIKPLWDRFASGESGYNAWVRTNIDLFAAAYPAPAADLVISSGKMSKTDIDSATFVDDNADVVVAWTDDTGEGSKLADDLAYVLVYNKTQATFGFSEGSVVRDTASATVTMGTNQQTGDEIYVYLAFKRADGTIVSNTAYLQASE